MTDYNPSPKYVLKNPESELQGAALLVLLESQKTFEFQDLVEKYDYNNVKADEWYSYQEAMNFLKDLADRYNRTENLVSIGLKVFDVLDLPDHVKTIADGLGMMNVMGDLTQRNIDTPHPWYQVEEINELHIKFTDRSPLPHDLIYGEVYSLTRRLRPEGFDFALTRNYLNADNPDADGAVYDIKLKRS